MRNDRHDGRARKSGAKAQPRICRTYTTDNCDWHGTEYNYDELFTSADQLRVYAEKKLGRSLPLKPKKPAIRIRKTKQGKVRIQLPIA